MAPSTLLAIGDGQFVLTYLDAAQTESLVGIPLPENTRYQAILSTGGFAVFEAPAGPGGVGVQIVAASVIDHLNAASVTDPAYPNETVDQAIWDAMRNPVSIS